MVVLADMIQRTQFDREVALQSIRKSVFWQTGVFINDTELSRLMNADIGSTFEFDFFLDLADNEGRISDDSATMAGTDGVTTDTSRAVGNYRNRSWGSRNIVSNLSATGDPLTYIAGRIGAYWGRQMDITAIAIVKGVLESNIVNDASDMINNQTGVPVEINFLHDTKQTMGDAGDELGLMITHSAVINKLRKDGTTDRIYDESGNFLYEAISNLRILANDNVPTGTDIPGGAAGDYLSYMVGGAFLHYGEGTPKRAHEVEYTAAIGNGAGQETIWSRKNFCIAPAGFNFTSASVASTSPTNAEFELAANFERFVDRKRVPFAALVCGI